LRALSYSLLPPVDWRAHAEHTASADCGQPLVDVTIGPAVRKFPPVPVHDGIVWRAWPVPVPWQEQFYGPLWAVPPLSGAGSVQSTR
jgi:hypothetical protein